MNKSWYYWAYHYIQYIIEHRFWLRIFSKYQKPTQFSLSPDEKGHMVFYLNKLEISVQKKAKSQVWFILVSRQGWTWEHLMPLTAYTDTRKILIRNAHLSPCLYKSVYQYPLILTVLDIWPLPGTNQYTSTTHIYDLELIDLWPWHVGSWLHCWPDAPIHDNINQLERKSQPNFKCNKFIMFSVSFINHGGGEGTKKIRYVLSMYSVFVFCARISF